MLKALLNQTQICFHKLNCFVHIKFSQKLNLNLWSGLIEQICIDCHNNTILFSPKFCLSGHTMKYRRLTKAIPGFQRFNTLPDMNICSPKNKNINISIVFFFFYNPGILRMKAPRGDVQHFLKINILEVPEQKEALQIGYFLFLNLLACWIVCLPCESICLATRI